MDDPVLDRRAHHTALHGLRRINLASRTAAVLWARIMPLAESRRVETLRLLDIATGGGDVAIALARRAQRAGIGLRVDGCDISATALRFATLQAERAGIAARFFPCDVLRHPLPAQYDIAVSTLFLHHLSDREIAALLARLGQSVDHLIISDLLRSRVGYGLAWAGTRLLSASPIVHEDGLRSVRAALTLDEARDLASEAGLVDARFESHWPCRFLLTWSRRMP